MQVTIKEIVEVIFSQYDYVPDMSIYTFSEMEEKLSSFLSSLKSLE